MARTRKSTSPATQFVVHRLNWRRWGNWDLQPGMLRVAGFASRAEADADCAARETNARRRVNPFEAAELNWLTSMPEGVFLDLVTDVGATPPPGEEGERNWEAWWPTLRDEQRLRLLEVFEQLRFYVVVERPAVPVAYAVISLYEDTNGEWEIINYEGGVIEGVWRTRKGARERASRCWVNHNVNPLGWFPSSVDPFDPEAHYQHFVHGYQDCDIIEVELHESGPSKGKKVHVVARRTWNPNHDNYPNGEERVPVAAFTDSRAAEERCRELEEEAWKEFNVYDLFSCYWEKEQDATFRTVATQFGFKGKANKIDRWWEQNAWELSDEQRAAFWRALPENRIYDIVEANLHN